MELNIILLSLLPAIIYIMLLYGTLPYNKINLGTAFIHLIIGFLSVALLKLIWLVFPSVTHFASSMISESRDQLKYFHYLYFGQVAFMEEISKLIIFLIITLYRVKKKKVIDHPIATMFYMGMVSLGFAVIENINYGQNYGESVLYWRAITSVIGHMVFGLFGGYWIALGRTSGSLYDRNLFNLLINNNKKVRLFLFTITGLLASTLLHGIYNLHLQLNARGGISGVYILLLFSVVRVYWCFNNLMKNHKKQIK